MNITNERLLLLQDSWILDSVHNKDVKYVDCVQQYFSAGKQERAYCSSRAVVAGFCSCLFTILCRDVICRMKWRRLRLYSPLPSAFIMSDLLYKQNINSHRKEVGRLWHFSKVDKSSPPLFDEKGFLLNLLIKELAGNWRLCPLHPHLSCDLPWQLLVTFGRFSDQLPTATWGNGNFYPNPPILGENPPLGGGGMVWVPSKLPSPPPHIGNSSFLTLSP